MSAVRQVTVVAGLIRRGEDVLLVQQQAPGDPAPSWALPGGVAEAGELLPEALRREIREETGLTVTQVGRLTYFVQYDAPPAGQQTLALVFEVPGWQGDLRPADPDDLVLGARFVPPAQAVELVEGHLPWRHMREPLVAHLRGAAPGTAWIYRERAPDVIELIAKL